MTETLLFLHVLAAFALVVGVVVYSAFALGAPATAGGRVAADRLWDIGGLGTLVFGVWLALDIGFYSITDGWILAALALWVVVAVVGGLARVTPAPAGGPGEAATGTGGGPPPAVWQWLRVGVVVALLAVMIWKPGA